MPKDARRTDAAGDVESLEDLVYRPLIAGGSRRVSSADPRIAVPLTLLGYLLLGLLGWRIVRYSRTVLVEIPKSVTVDLQDVGEGDVPVPAPDPAPAPAPAPGGTPKGAIERPDAMPPPSIPDDVPEKPPTELPAQDLSQVAFPPAAVNPGPGGTGTGTSPSGTGVGEETGGAGTGLGPRVVEYDFSKVSVKFEPDLEYPATARRMRIQGTVKVNILVGLDGLPVSAKAFEGPPFLRSSAEAYALKWRFEPSTENGTPVLANFVLTVVYRLR